VCCSNVGAPHIVYWDVTDISRSLRTTLSQCVAVCCSNVYEMLQTFQDRWEPNCCSVLQCVAAMLQCVAAMCMRCRRHLKIVENHTAVVCCSVLQSVAVCCRVLQSVAVCCRVLQCVAAMCPPPPHCVLRCLGMGWLHLVGSIKLYRCFLQNTVSFIGLFCKRDL